MDYKYEEILHNPCITQLKAAVSLAVKKVNLRCKFNLTEEEYAVAYAEKVFERTSGFWDITRDCCYSSKVKVHSRIEIGVWTCPKRGKYFSVRSYRSRHTENFWCYNRDQNWGHVFHERATKSKVIKDQINTNRRKRLGLYMPDVVKKRRLDEQNITYAAFRWFTHGGAIADYVCRIQLYTRGKLTGLMLEYNIDDTISIGEYRNMTDVEKFHLLDKVYENHTRAHAEADDRVLVLEKTLAAMGGLL